MSGLPPATAQASAPDQARLLTLVWWAFLGAIALYTPIPFFVTIAEGAAEPVPEAVRSGMSFAALGAGVSSVLARRWWTNSLHAALERDDAAQVRAELWARLRAGCIVTWALSEAVALLGLVLAIITRHPFEGVAFVVGGAALLLYHRPANWPVDQVARAAERGA